MIPEFPLDEEPVGTWNQNDGHVIYHQNYVFTGHVERSNQYSVKTVKNSKIFAEQNLKIYIKK